MIHPKPPNDSSVKQSPWLVGEQRFSRISDHDQISQILKEIRDNNLFVIIATPDGQDTLFYDSFLLDIKKERIILYKTSRWAKNEGGEDFRVFFRNIDGHWHTLKAELEQHAPHSLSIYMPKTIYMLNPRGHDRLQTPPETKATFIYANNPAGDFQVVNISNTGMLIRSYRESPSLPIFSRLKDICIDLPGRDDLPTIKQAQIVRRFRTDKNNMLCYGVLFKKECNARKEIIWELLSEKGCC